MKLIETNAVKLMPNRQRRHFDPAKMHEFADQIEQNGLFHPIILRVVGDHYFLVAGERRLRAVKDIHELGGSFRHDDQEVPSGQIPYIYLGELDPLEAAEAELSENIHREDLTWQERATAHARLNELRTAQAELRGEEPPKVADIALEVRGSAEGVNQEKTRRELIVAEHLDNPEVSEAKTVDEAFKVLRRIEATEKNRELGVQVGKTFTSAVHQVLNTDSLEWMKEAETGQFDCILTDPPYGMGADEFGDSGGKAAGAHGYADDRDALLLTMITLAPESYRLAKEQAHLYCFCDIDYFTWMKDIFIDSGWWVHRTPLIWYKRTAARMPWPEHGPQRKYEVILYAVKGKRPTLKIAPDVLDFLPDENLGHSAQKPVALFQELLSRTCLPGNSVLDPFCGTGPIFPAAHELKCRAVGLEEDLGPYGIAVKRIEQLQAQQELDMGE